MLWRRHLWLTLGPGLALVAGCAHRGGGGDAWGEGNASWYGKSLAGHRTASGEPFDPGALTAAHRTLPFGTCVRVENLGDGRSVEVRVNDRGPFTGDRLIDLSHAAAQRLGAVDEGVIRVRLSPCR